MQESNKQINVLPFETETSCTPAWDRCSVGLLLFFPFTKTDLIKYSACFSVYQICFFFAGIGYASCLIGSYVFIYYNTVIAWAFYYLFR